MVEPSPPNTPKIIGIPARLSSSPQDDLGTTLNGPRDS
jgi:hypothetical protein